MCHYVTAYVPSGSKLDAVKSLLDRNKLGFDLIQNPHVAAQIDGPVHQILTTRKYCDCGTALASGNVADSGGVPTERAVDRLRKRGWSEARIDRWAAEKAVAAERRRAAREHYSAPSGPELEVWVRVIRETLETRAAGWIGLLVHWYDRGVESERIALKPPQRVAASELSETVLRDMSEDALLIVRACNGSVMDFNPSNERMRT